jgi:hypothetical protein
VSPAGFFVHDDFRGCLCYSAARLRFCCYIGTSDFWFFHFKTIYILKNQEVNIGFILNSQQFYIQQLQLLK